MELYSLPLNVYDIENEKLSHTIELTPKEQSILNLIIKGLMNKQIAKYAKMTTRNVEYYVSRLFLKTTSKNRADLVRYCVQNKINV